VIIQHITTRQTRVSSVDSIPLLDNTIKWR